MLDGRIYLDHAATSPLRPCARDAWLEASTALNPGGQYASGRKANAIVACAQEIVAEILGVDPVEVIFTASGTESCNLAIRGLYQTARKKNGHGHGAPTPVRIVSTPVEHPAVFETVKDLEAHDPNLVSAFLPLQENGTVIADPDVIGGEKTTTTALATVMWANNETGAVNPIADIAKLCGQKEIPLHVDATQALGKIPVHLENMAITTLSGSAHKFGGPRGTGLLIARRSPHITPVITGGGQQRGIRPGTVNVAGAIATATALKDATQTMAAEEQRLETLRNKLHHAICTTIPNSLVHTPGLEKHTDPTAALAGHLLVSFPGSEGDCLIMLLDNQGFECSTGSACHAGVNRASHVLLAMGISEHDARGTIRFTLGSSTTEDDIDKLIAALPDIVARARLAGMA